MRFQLSYSWLVLLLLLISSISTELHYVCDVCTCDNFDHPTTVNCNGKQLTTLTNIFFNSTIEKLTLGNNSLTFKTDDDLPSINNLTTLKYLDLSRNPLATIPALTLEHLEYLNFEETELTSASFPSSYENSTRLHSLVLSKNKLAKISAHDLRFFTALTTLSLDADQLSSLDHETFAAHRSILESLSLASNSLQSTEFLFNLNDLLSIDLDDNHLAHFPKELINASRIKYVSLRNNRIEAVDELSPLFHWMKTNRSDIEVHLSQNPFDCCQSRWLIHYLSGSKNFVRDAANLTCASPKVYTGQHLLDLHADLMNCSDEPFHPPNLHWSKSAIVFLAFFSVTTVIFAIIGLILYRRGIFPFHTRQHAYEPIAGDNLPGSI